MRIRQQSMTLTLHGEDIDHFSEWLDEVQLSMRMDRTNRIRVRLLVEDILLRMRDRFGEEASLTATCETRLGRPRLRMELRGEPFNPLSVIDSNLGGWESSLTTAIGLSPQYSYEGERNVLRLPLPHASMNPLLRMGIAILVGTLVGVLGRIIVAEQFLGSLAYAFLVPVYEVWCRLLNGISGPIIFLTVTTTLLNTQRIEERGGSSLMVIVRYFVVSILTVSFALLCALPFFHLRHVDLVLNKELVNSLFDSLWSVVPSNITEPFLGANTSQLLFLAFALGYVLRQLGGRVDLLTGLVRQANIVGLEIAGWVSWLVPIVAGTFLCLEVWERGFVVLAQLWQPLFTALVFSSITVLAMCLVLSESMRVNPLRLVRKLLPSFVTAVRTGSLDSSFEEAESTCTERLGIESTYAKVGFPQGLVLFMPISAVGTIVFTLFVAQVEGVQGGLSWYLTAVILAVVVFVATPPVPGANLLAYVALFTTLGIPADALLDAMIFDIVFGVFAGAANQAMLQLEMVFQANRLGLLDRDVLRNG